jgi:hypothetical protein
VATDNRQITAAPPLRVKSKFEQELSGSNRDAYAALRAQFDKYGLGSLSGRIFDYLKEGYSADTIFLLLQETPEYKKRFAGNETRRQQGFRSCRQTSISRSSSPIDKSSRLLDFPGVSTISPTTSPLGSVTTSVPRRSSLAWIWRLRLRSWLVRLTVGP